MGFDALISTPICLEISASKVQAKFLSLLGEQVFRCLQRQRKNKKGTGVAGERKEGVERMGGAGGPFEAEIPPQSPGHTWVPNPVTGRGWGVLGFNT